MAQYFQISYDQLKQLIPGLSGTVGEENVQYAVVNHGQEVTLNNVQLGNIQAQEDARQSISNNCISELKAEQLNGQYSIALKSDTPDPNNIYVLESVSSSNPETVHIQNSVSAQADHHQNISAGSNHLQTIYIAASPQQVVPAVTYISVPHTVVNEVSETPELRTPTKNNCQVFSTEEVQVPTANSSLSRNKENLMSSEEKEAEESEEVIHSSVLAGAQVSLPNGQQISLQDYRRMNPQINSVQPSKGLARSNSGIRQFRVRRPPRRGGSVHSPVRQSSPANSLTPGRMFLVDHSAEGEPMQYVVRNDSVQESREQEQQQVATRQDSNTGFQFGQGDERQQVVMVVSSGSGEQMVITMPAGEAPSNMSPVTTPENSPRAVGKMTPSNKFASSPSGAVIMSPSQKRSIGPEGVIEQSSSTGFIGSPTLSKQCLEERKLVPGKVAHCQYCGYHSEDFNRCERCRRKVPVNCKEMPITHSKVSKEGISCQKFYRGMRESTLADNIQKSERGLRRKPRKQFEEPVILTISSDEDEDAEGKTDAKPKDKNDLDADSGLISMHSEVDPLLLPITSISALEPVIRDNEEHVSEDETDVGEEIAAGVLELHNGIGAENVESRPVYLTCRTVRIGSYKAVPKERVIICKQGIRICVPDIEDGSKFVTITFRLKDVVRALIHFGRAMPVIFLYTTHPCAVKIRSMLNMSAKRGPYYDPTCNEETQKRITLLPERMTEETKTRLKMLFSSKDLLIELDNKDANEILVRASPKEVQETIKKTVAAASPTMGTPRPSKDYFQKILIYPPPPAKGGITINPEDYCCLGEEQFLNDVIIDFYLKYLTQSCLSEEDQQRTHVFSSFFYKRLTTRPVRSARRHHPMELDSSTTPAEKRHARVKSWTKNVDIFEKDFIVIPINESAHWFLAIICFPGLEGCVKLSDGTPVKLPPPQPKSCKKTKVEMPKCEVESKEMPPQTCIMKSIQIGSTTITPITPPGVPASNLMMAIGDKEPVSIEERDGGTIVDDMSDRDEAEGEEEEDIQMPSDSEDEAQQEGKEEKTEATGKEEEKSVEGTIKEIVQPADEIGQSTDDKAPEKAEITSEEKEASKETPEKKPKDPGIEYCASNVPIKQPCILIFDSLAGSSRSRVVATLRDYLRIEYKVKKGKEKEFSKDTIRGACPRVPQQTNFVDCGVYVLQYVESFFQNPVKDYRIPIRSLTQWFPEEVAHTKREAIHELILKLMKEQNITCKLPKITLPSATSRANQPNPQDEESVKKLEICNKLVEPGQLIIKSKEGGHRLVTSGLKVISFSKNSLNLVLETQCEDGRLVSEMQMGEEGMQASSSSQEEQMEVEEGEAVEEEMEEGEVVEPKEGVEKPMEEEEGELRVKQRDESHKVYTYSGSPLATKRKSIKQDVLEPVRKESNDIDSPNKKSKC